MKPLQASTIVAVIALASLARGASPSTAPSSVESDLRRIIGTLQGQVASLRAEVSQLRLQLAEARKPPHATSRPSSDDPELAAAIAEVMKGVKPPSPDNDGAGKYEIHFTTKYGEYDTAVDAISFGDALRKATNMRLPLTPNYDEEGLAVYYQIKKVGAPEPPLRPSGRR